MPERDWYAESQTEARFWEKVERRGPDECWLWTGSKTGNGYGRFYFDGRMGLAHRYAYERFVGPIPEGMQLDHVEDRGCTNRHCVNHAHLEPVTGHENVHRGRTNATKTHCANGHAYDEANTLVARDGARKCRACNRERARARRATGVR